jgi:hypothetical protein
MKKKYKIIIISFGVVGVLVLGIFGAFVGAGNGGYAQQYEFDVNSSIIIKAVENLKIGNPIFNLPESIYEPDSLDASNSQFNMGIYSKKENISFLFFIEKNPNNVNKSSLYLVSINRGMDYRDWKTVNHDLDRAENLMVKRVFQEEILNKLKLNYKNKGNNMFIFWK